MALVQNYQNDSKGKELTASDRLSSRLTELREVISEIASYTSDACGSYAVVEQAAGPHPVPSGRVEQWIDDVEGLVDRARDISNALRRTFG